jgi:imidazolonepropionase-like amidohydrolase
MMAQSKRRIAFTHGIMIGGPKGMEPEDEATIIVEDGVIADVGHRLSVPYGCEEVDLDGRYIMPGLINIHARLYESGFPGRKHRDPIKEARSLMRSRFGRTVAYNRCAAYARTQLLSGVTTLRSPGSMGDIDARLKAAIEKKGLIGPRLLISNMEIATSADMVTDKVACVARNPEDCAELAARMAAGKGDWLSLMISSREEQSGKMVRLACEKAHELGLKVSAECEGESSLVLAAGQGVSLLSETTACGLSWDTVNLIKDHGVAYISSITPKIAAICAATPDRADEAGRDLEKTAVSLRRLMENGVALGIGTDPGTPYATHYDMWRELEYLRRFTGVTREEALAMATSGNAAILGMEDKCGSIEPGKSADMIVTSGNPLTGLEALRVLHMVICRGDILTRPKPVKNTSAEEALDRKLLELW